MRKTLSLTLLMFAYFCFPIHSKQKYQRQAYMQGNTDYVGKQKLSVESTYIFEKDHGSSSYYLPNNLLSYGVNDDFEILLDLDFFYAPKTHFGILPASLGLKYNLLHEDKRMPQIDIIGKLQSENLGTANYHIRKTLPFVAFYVTKNFTKNFHSVLDVGIQSIDSTKQPSYFADFTSEYDISKKVAVNFEINEFSSKQRFVNLILGIGTIYNFSDDFSLEFDAGKYLKNSTQNYYYSLNIKKTFDLAKKKK